ncbi:Glyceraldehyde-3-phosphate dehydrogenase, partial [Lemmus lemmus]
MMVEIRLNVFGHIACLVTRAVACSSKVEIIAINDPFIHLNYMVYMLQYNSTHDKFNSTVKAENGKLVINSKAVSIFQKQNPASIKCCDAGAKNDVESTGVFTGWKRLG